MNKTLPGHLDIDGIRRDEHGKKIIIDDLMKINDNHNKSIKEISNHNKNSKNINNEKKISNEDILKSRKNKDKNKSKIANHNRKKNSNKKMNKGMF
jgi:hypothetical protein|tara:strand:+ start:166 stop:453 length:288 start_codon:yes stop_codon:yes gene_type:complete